MAEPEAPAVMTQAEYARHRGCSRQYVHKLVKSGALVLSGELIKVSESDAALPDIARPADDPPPPDAETDFVAAPGTALSQAQLRKLEAEASFAELKLAERAGRLIDRDEATQLIGTFFGDLADKLAALPIRVAEQILTLKTAREVSTTLTEAIETELRAFSARVADLLNASSSAADAAEVTDVPQDQTGERAADSGPGDRESPDPGTPPNPV